jgi:hypothetical protein
VAEIKNFTILYKNVEAQISQKFKNVVVISLVAIFLRLKSKSDVLIKKENNVEVVSAMMELNSRTHDYSRRMV